jgi:hypothetical protein
MNVADLLDDAPSDKRRQPQREQQPQQPPPQPPPPVQHRERSRERPPSGHSQQQLPPPPPHQHLHPPQPSYHTQSSSRNVRPLSPSRTFPPEYGGNHPQTQQRLPPPSAIMNLPDHFDIKHRRQEHEPLPPMSHEMGVRPQHGPLSSSMGPPGECHCSLKSPFLVLCRSVACRSLARLALGQSSSSATRHITHLVFPSYLLRLESMSSHFPSYLGRQCRALSVFDDVESVRVAWKTRAGEAACTACMFSRAVLSLQFLPKLKCHASFVAAYSLTPTAPFITLTALCRSFSVWLRPPSTRPSQLSLAVSDTQSSACSPP